MDETEIRYLAQYAEDNGAHSKASMLRHLADEMELYEPVVDAVRQEYEADEYDRERVENNIRQEEK